MNKIVIKLYAAFQAHLNATSSLQSLQSYLDGEGPWRKVSRLLGVVKGQAYGQADGADKNTQPRRLK